MILRSRQLRPEAPAWRAAGALKGFRHAAGDGRRPDLPDVGAIAMDHAPAGGQERRPGRALRVGNPRLLGLGVAAGRRPFL